MHDGDERILLKIRRHLIFELRIGKSRINSGQGITPGSKGWPTLDKRPRMMVGRRSG
jgi:hypothetical protein